MLLPLLFALIAAPPLAGTFPASALPGEMPPPGPAPTKWDRTPIQIAAGSLGATLGTVTGGAGGFALAALIAPLFVEDRSCSEEALLCLPPSLGIALVAGGVGAIAGGMTGTALGVRWSAPESHPSLRFLPPFLGAGLGGAAGFGLAVAAASGDPWTGAAIVALGAAGGATLLDRLATDDAAVAAGPWIAPSGGLGLRLSARY